MFATSNKKLYAYDIHIIWFSVHVLRKHHEPIHVHVHVIKGDVSAKFTLFPVTLVKNNGLKPSEIKLAESVIEENQEIIAEHWNKFFNKIK